MQIKELFIKAFRGIRNAKFTDMRRVNYLVGENNSGKTSALEAIVAGGCFSDINMLIDTVFARSQKQFLESARNMLIPQKCQISSISMKLADKSSRCTEISCEESERVVQENEKIHNIKSLTVKYTFSNKGNSKELKNSFWINFEKKGTKTQFRKDPLIAKKGFLSIPCQFVSFSRFDRTDKIMDALDSVLQKNQRQELLEVLQIFDSKVINFEVIGDDRLILIFREGETENESLFLNDYGNGMYKAFYIACAALKSQEGVLLIDELEAGIHHKALEKFVEFLEVLSKKNSIQLFITTHSLELVDVASKCHPNDDLMLYNMQIDETVNETIVRNINKEDLEYMRNEIGVDIR